MAAFSRRVRTYQDVFPSSDASFVNPSDVSDVVQLTHPFLPAGQAIAESVIDSATGAPGTNPVATHAAVPLDKYWYVPFWHIQHNDPVDRVIEFSIVRTSLDVLIQSTWMMGILNGLVPANIAIALRRPILVPPGFILTAGTIGLAGAQVITTRVVRVELPLAEEAPRF